jgi:hypothetical protein
MSSDRIDDHLKDSSGLPVVHFREHGHSLLEGYGTPLDLAADEHLAGALRRREDAFNEDVLPPDVRLEAPLDFYAAIGNRGLRAGAARASDFRDDLPLSRIDLQWIQGSEVPRCAAA